MEDAKELLRAIDELVEKKTFSLDAIEAIQAVRKRATELQKVLDDTSYKLHESKKHNLELRTQNVLLEGEREATSERERAIRKREEKMTELELNVAVASAKVAILDSVLGRLLANRQIRESSYNQVPVYTPYSGGGGNHEMKNSSNSSTKEEA